MPQPVLSFGEGPTLDYASSGSWTITGDGVALSFGVGDSITAASGQRDYERTVGGSVQRFTITDTIAGFTPDFVRSFTLRADRSTGQMLYSCVFGVPAAVVDGPTTTVSYARVGINGTAYVAQNGGVQTYVLTASTGAARFDPTTRALVVTMHLVGNLRMAGGTSTATTDLGTFTGSGAIDATRGRFYGQLDSNDRVSQFSSFGGWFFGGTEAGAAFEILAADPATGSRVSIVGSLVAAR
jgi:hypothetical protein